MQRWSSSPRIPIGPTRDQTSLFEAPIGEAALARARTDRYGLDRAEVGPRQTTGEPE